MRPRHARRIVVVGTTGSGKTRLAHVLARRLDIRHVELDALHWGPNWTEVPDATFRERTARAVAGDACVVDGNYHAVRDLVWPRAEMVVWLDYSFPRVMWRLLRRTIWRLVTREQLWNDNRERLREQLFSRRSLFLWALRTYGRRRREYAALFELPEHAHLHVVRLRSPRATREWLAGITDRGPMVRCRHETREA